MYLQTTVSSPHSLQQLPLSSTAFYSRTTLPLSLRSSSLVLHCPNQNPRVFISCSVSQFHNYGTLDYENRPVLKWSSLYRRISLMENPSLGSSTVLDQWEEEGRKLSKWDLCRVVKELRKYRRYQLALQVYEWMIDQGERFKLTTSDTAIQLDLISKVHGVSSAEDYFSKLPETSKDKRTYGALLNAYVQAQMKEKAEALVEKIKSVGYATEALPYNVMMTLYMNIREFEKVMLVIYEMREKSIPLDVYSYNIWITTCASMGDAEKMEQVVEQMTRDSGVKANWTTYSTLASMYIKLGHFEKAGNCLKDVELRITGRDRAPYNYLVSLYSNIGKREDVYRIWNCYKSSFPGIPNLGYKSMISSLVRLGDIDGAEAVYKEWLSSRSTWDPRICNILMIWYTKEGLMKKAENFLDDIHEVGVKPNTNTWELMAEGYIKEKQISKALSCIKEAASIERTQIWQPKPANIAALLSLCEEQADTASVEMLKGILRRVGCLDMELYKSLIGTNLKADMAIDELNLYMEDDEIGRTAETEILLK